MKLVNEYNTPMGVMRHEIADDGITKWKSAILIPTEEEVNTIADAKDFIREEDREAWKAGWYTIFAVLLAIAVFSLWLII